MVSFTDLRCRRLIQLVESNWKGSTAEIFLATEDKIVFRVRTIGGRYRTEKITLPGSISFDRVWLAGAVANSILN